MQLIGVIHLLPLPAGPAPSPGLADVAQRALQDAQALVDGGVHVAVIENLGDAPFQPGPVDSHVVSMMTAIAGMVNQQAHGQLSLGVNILRNDARAALAVAAAVDATFVRVNVHVGAAWTDQGLIQGQAADTLRYRRELGLQPTQPIGMDSDWVSRHGHGVAVAADVHVKHATPAGTESIADAAADLALRGRADVVIVSGRHTGGQTDIDDVVAVRRRLPKHPVWVGSGVEPSGVRAMRDLVDGAIVGTWLHRDGVLSAPLDVDRVRWMVQAMNV